MASNRSKEVPPSLRIEEDKQKEQEDPSPQYDYNNGGTDSRNEKILAPNLNFSTDVRGAIAMADVIFITVNTPSKVNIALFFYREICLSEGSFNTYIDQPNGT